ncbi:MAG: DUF368 domain-containing protein [Eudoraea sp.]|nr:DUF368 domain-containing protein [Eudoraea sp.]
MAGRTLLQYGLIALKGMAMGAADVVPGVSGGTIAFISGIYIELIESINGINGSLFLEWRKNGFASFWKKANGNFLMALFSGIAISVFTLARLISWLLETHPIMVWSFFFGLVIASVIYVGRAIKQWNFGAVAFLILGAGIAFMVTRLPVLSDSASMSYIFLSGALAVCAMILPGISGAFILVLLGSYKYMLDAVHQRDIQTLLVAAAGAVVGLLSFARLLKWMFAHFRNITLALLTGFIIGSLNKIWPWKKVTEVKEIGDKIIAIKEESVLPSAFDGDPQITWALILAIIGFALIFILEKLAAKKEQK